MADTRPETREMYAEIAALVAAVGKAFALSEDDAAQALEDGEITLEFGRDSNGNRFVLAQRGETSARIYQGAIKQEG